MLSGTREVRSRSEQFAIRWDLFCLELEVQEGQGRLPGLLPGHVMHACKIDGEVLELSVNQWWIQLEERYSY